MDSAKRQISLSSRGLQKQTPSAGPSSRRRKKRGFTLTEVVFATFIAGLSGMIFFNLTNTWRISEKKTTVQAGLLLDGSTTLERVLRDLRDEMVGISGVNQRIGNVVKTLVILADTDHDGVGDSLKAWGISPSDTDGNGVTDMVDLNGDGVNDTLLWDFVMLTAHSTTNLETATWQTKVLCNNLTAPWKSDDGKVIYHPFEFQGSDPEYDLGLDGKLGTKDALEADGILSEVELGNIINANGKIDHIGEEVKITSIGLGLRLAQSSAHGDVESVIIYRGRIDPRNWHPCEKN